MPDLFEGTDYKYAQIQTDYFENPKVNKEEYNIFEKRIDENCNSDDLRKFCSTISGIKSTTNTKDAFINIIYIIFSSKKNIEIFFKQKGEVYKEIFYVLVWNGPKFISDLENKYQIEIIAERNSWRKNLKNDYRIFNVYHGEILLLNDFLRDFVKDKLEKPDGYEFKYIDNIKDFKYIEENEQSILENLTLYKEFLIQDKIFDINPAEKISKTIVKKMKNYCGINNYCDDKDNQNIKVELILSFLHKILNYKKKYNDSLEMLKGLIDSYINEKGNFSEFKSILYHLRVNSGVYLSTKSGFRRNIANFISNFEVNRWVDIENIIKYIIYRNIDLNLIYYDYDLERVYINILPDASYYYNNKKYIDMTNYRELFFDPLIKGIFFLFSNFGILDIAYDDPPNSKYKIKSDKPYNSIFDGLKYVRLTKLGAYILGISDKYENELKDDSDTGNVILSNDTLVATLDKENKIKRLYLQTAGEQISEFSYKIGFSSFFKNCNTKEEVEERIDNFKKVLPNELPEIWVNFFDEMKNKLNPFESVENMIVVKISDNNKELIRILATDKNIKKYIIKMENYQFAIKKSDVKKLVNILGEYGYFISDFFNNC